MGEHSKIEWTDHTFNPWWGCAKVSEACTHCYAETLADRWRADDKLWRGNRSRTSASNWKQPRKWDRDAARDGTRPRVFCASMADVFEDHAALPAWRADLWPLLEQTPNLTWLLLTKRPENVLRMVPRSWVDDNRCDFRAKPELWPANVWVGATAENQERLDERAAHLVRVPAPVKFLSCEPLVGPLDASRWLGDNYSPTAGGFGHGIRWVIVGGESGPKARPSHPDWFRSLREQCATAGVPFHFKQWGEWVEDDGVPAWRDHPDRDFQVHAFGDGGEVVRVGKVAAGRLLDGVEHNGLPEVSRG